MFNGAMSSKQKGAPMGSWQSEAEPRVIYCGQKEVRTSTWILFVDDLGTGTTHFFHACLLTMYINSHRHIYCFFHPISKCAHSRTGTQLFTLARTAPPEDVVAFKQSEELLEFKVEFYFRIPFAVWMVLKCAKITLSSSDKFKSEFIHRNVARCLCEVVLDECYHHSFCKRSSQMREIFPVVSSAL